MDLFSYITGAIKLHNFIPWDIDGDIHLAENTMQHFHRNGKARKLLENNGILFHDYQKDNSADPGGAKDAGLYRFRIVFFMPSILTLCCSRFAVKKL